MGIEKQRTNTYAKPKFKKVTGWAQCDYSAFPINKTDQVRQDEYDGNGLYYKSYLVHKDFVDIPQQQFLKPKIYKDPVPIPNARIIPDNTD